MKPITIKRIKLSFCLVGIPLIIALFCFFFHILFLTPYINNEVELMSSWFREEIYREIREEIHTDNEIKLLWLLSEKDVIKKVDTKNLSKVILILYFTISFFVMVFTAILTKWYTSNNSNFIIQDKEN